MRLPAWRKRAVSAGVSLATLIVLMLSTIQAAPGIALAAPAGNPRPEDVVNSCFDHQGRHYITYRSGVETIDGNVVASSVKSPEYGKTGANSNDYKAWVANGRKPVVVNPADMVESTVGIPTEVTPPIAVPNCYSPPPGWNIAKASDPELAKYGFPPAPRDPGSRDIYNRHL